MNSFFGEDAYEILSDSKIKKLLDGLGKKLIGKRKKQMTFTVQRNFENNLK